MEEERPEGFLKSRQGECGGLASQHGDSGQTTHIASYER